MARCHEFVTMVGVLPHTLEHEIAEVNPTVIDLLPPRLLQLSLRDEPSMDEMTKTLKCQLESCWASWFPGPTANHSPPLIRPVLSHNHCQSVGDVRKFSSNENVLHKTKHGTDCNTSRWILLVTHASKTLLNIIACRLSNYCETEELLPEEQCGFRPAQSTIETLFVLRRLQQLGRQRTTPLYVCVILRLGGPRSCVVYRRPRCEHCETCVGRRP